ncbi:[protein-PII] uridylyltransferase [Ampullimonas aquatilis]|uniref:[protein-PII] uridylyltransferase n=1 Tax=Ampullimonas aquatilis TaxID=1341549 RepID=UPI003C708501
MSDQTAHPINLTELRSQLKASREALFAQFEKNGNCGLLLHKHRLLVDELLKKLWHSLTIPSSLALVAVGGFGRGELYPYSDVDVLFLLPKNLPNQPEKFAELQGKIETLVGMFWDLGLDLGHSVRTIEQCLEESGADITVQTSLLEARLITGNHRLFSLLTRLYDNAMDSKAFFRAKVMEMRQRHSKYEDTPYSLEPNCKESPGGLRDLQLILWVAKAAGFGNSWNELCKRRLITQFESKQLQRNEGILKKIRCHLHLICKRREDRLVFDVQQTLAERFHCEAQASKRASEVLMQRYYWSAKAVTQLNTILLQNIEARLFPVSKANSNPLEGAFASYFRERNGLLDLVDGDCYDKNSSLILATFLTLAQNKQLSGLTANTMRRLWHARDHIDEAFRKNPVNRALFMDIIHLPFGVTHALRNMNRLSILGRYLPSFRRIVGQMQHDLFHVYTVDQHILMVLRNIRRFMFPEYAHEYPFCSQLIANFERPWVLYVAALFHDIAKGRGGDHSELGERDVRRFCREHEIDKEDTELICFLVKQHLQMSQVAQKQDMSNPEVIANFARMVKNERYLTALYLLTVADVRGTSPKVWNAWKGRLLEELYRMTKRALGGEPPSATAELEQRKRDAIKSLRLYGFSEFSHEAFWKTLDVAYFLRHDANDIAWQTRHLHDQLTATEPVVSARLAPSGEGMQVMVYAKDRPELFALICAYFDSKNMSILDAKIHTTNTQYALDSFMVIDDDMSNYRALIEVIEYELNHWLLERTTLPVPRKGRMSRQSKHFPIKPRVDLRPDERGQHYFLSITANDRTGLLYTIAYIIAEYKLNLHTAKIMTLGERVEDVFLIDGPALNNNKTQIQFETRMLEAMAV